MFSIHLPDHFESATSDRFVVDGRRGEDAQDFAALRMNPHLAVND